MTAAKENWVALLGVKGGPAINPHGSMPTSSLLRLDGKTIVVDCGAGVALGLARQGIALKMIDAVFITHLHSDHYLDLGPLLHTAWTAGLARKVPVFGPNALQEYWDHFIASMHVDIDTRMADEGRPDLKALVELHELHEGAVADIGDIEITALRNLHPPLVDSFALRFEGASASVVFSGDTAFFPPLAEFARDVSLLIHEAMYPEGIDRLVARIGNGDDRLRKHMFASHTPIEDAGRIAAMAEVGCLAIHHLVPCDDREIKPADWEMAARRHWKGSLHIGRDGLRIPVVSAA
jgi:ribonuclease BN (tRNA processing enzyme)